MRNNPMTEKELQRLEALETSFKRQKKAVSDYEEYVDKMYTVANMTKVADSHYFRLNFLRSELDKWKAKNLHELYQLRAKLQKVTVKKLVDNEKHLQA